MFRERSRNEQTDACLGSARRLEIVYKAEKILLRLLYQTISR
jgi:hypothetical protein